MNEDAPVYRDAGRPLAERVDDLLARMTRAEKLAQVGSVWAFEVLDGEELELTRLRGLAADGLGHLTRLVGSTNLLPRAAARLANEIQRFLVEETRLGIPALIHEECLHGLMARGAPVFQQSIGAAATFDPGLVREMATTIRRRMLAIGARQALGPVLDISRDPRWGRIEETYGEDPFLAATLGTAYVEALQGADLSSGVLATLKHLVGHGIAEGGLNQAPVHIGWRELFDEQLLPFEAAIVGAGAGSVMPAYCDVDGLPCHAAHELLTTILRERWAFDGIVVSDYAGIEMLRSAHRLSDDLPTVARLALSAGVDVELPRSLVYGEPLRAALDEGCIPEDLLDTAVVRVLRTKMRLGLFERPYVDEPTHVNLGAIARDEAAVARELARRSMVLTVNDGVLPLTSAQGRVAVLGAGADSARDLIGDYAHLVHIAALNETRRSGSTAFGIVVDGPRIDVEDELDGMATVLAALRLKLPAADISHVPASATRDPDDAAIRASAAAAADADVAIVVAAERSGLTDDSTTGEFRDRQGLGLSGRQQELLEAVVATGTPVVLVVISGRPLALEWAAQHCAAVLLAWVPGTAGAEAIADILTGVCEPGGRLPVTIPRHVGQVPLAYRHHPTGGRSNPKGDHVDGPSMPLWPFGFGLSYARFALEALSLSSDQMPTADGQLTISVEVANVGQRAGEEVVQLYVRDEQASVARPVLELLGFQRVALGAGERCTIEFTIHSEQLAYTGADYRRVVEPGRVSVHVGTSAADLELSANFELVGELVELTARRHFTTRAMLSARRPAAS